MKGVFTFPRTPILVRGGGDLASGVVYRLYRAGFPVVVTEIATPLAVRRTVSFAQAVYDGHITVEGITGRLVRSPSDIRPAWERGEVPILIDPQACVRDHINFVVVVDAIMAKRNTGTRMDDAPLVIALGPGFIAGRDCHAVVETMRGHFLGRVYWQGTAMPDTGTPGKVMGYEQERVLRAPADGHVTPLVEIGDPVEEGQIVCTVDGHPVRAPFPGVLRGLVHPRVSVHRGMKIGDVDPRARREHCFTISDKSLAVGGGVLEAVLAAPQVRRWIRHES